MPKLKLREIDINITKEEARKIGDALLEGIGFIRIGSEVVNSKYVIGIFESSDPEPQFDRLLKMPKPEKKDFEGIKQMLLETRKELEKKGILKKEKNIKGLVS